RRGGSGAPFNKAILTSTKFEEERIDTKNYGVLYCIRAIKGNVYACGQSSQVYMRADGHWGPVGQGITNDNSITFESIDGNGADDIYAVGQEGAVFHFNGYRWRQISFPTNRPLSSIRCISKQEVYICGNDGLFFKGHDDSWEDLTDVSKSYNFWDVEIFQNCVYLSHHKGIVVFDGQIHADVDFRMQKAVSCHKLHANDGCLWSFGVDDLLKFDGSNWMEVLCPENEPRAGE
ncbi:MAG: hypothetical protein HZB24_02985, partial [Desulfobacterales bacterium]|nr:hypothetical protein [Desulfobacterales bacterium]